MKKISIALLVVTLLILFLAGCPWSKDDATYFTLTMLEPVGQGTVVPVVGEHSYKEGRQIQLKATEADGWDFAEWEVDAEFYSSEAIANLVIDSDVVVQAFFTEIAGGDPVTVIVRADPYLLGEVQNFGGEVQVNNKGFTGMDEVEVVVGEVVTIEAREFDGWVFLGWFQEAEIAAMGGEPFCEELTCEFAADSDMNLVAYFDPNIVGETTWEVVATMNNCEWWDDGQQFIGEGTVTITEEPARMVGTALINPDLDVQQLLALVRGVMQTMLDRAIESASESPVLDFQTVEIPPENLIEFEYIDTETVKLDYDVTFHGFDPDEPEETAITWATAKYTIRFSHDFIIEVLFAVEVIGRSLQPHLVEFIALIHDNIPGYEPLSGELTVVSERKTIE